MISNESRLRLIIEFKLTLYIETTTVPARKQNLTKKTKKLNGFFIFQYEHYANK